MSWFIPKIRDFFSLLSRTSWLPSPTPIPRHPGLCVFFFSGDWVESIVFIINDKSWPSLLPSILCCLIVPHNWSCPLSKLQKKKLMGIISILIRPQESFSWFLCLKDDISLEFYNSCLGATTLQLCNRAALRARLGEKEKQKKKI